VVLVEADHLDLAELAGLFEGLVDLRRVVGIDAHHAVDARIGRQRVLDVALGPGLVDVVGPHVDERDLGARDGGLDALDPLARIIGAGQAHEAHALAPVGHGLLHQLAGLLAGIDVAGANIDDALAVRGVAVGGEQHGAGADLVEFVDLRLGVDGADHDAARARSDEIVHQAVLDGGRGLFGIFQLQGVVGQFALRLFHAGFRGLPEIRGAVDDEIQRLLVGSLGGRTQAGRSQGRKDDMADDLSHTIRSGLTPDRRTIAHLPQLA